MPRHGEILDFLEALGYKETKRGHCHGIGNIILQSFFVEDGFDTCLNRLKKIETILQSAKACTIPYVHKNFLKKVKDEVDAFPPEEKYDLYAFCDSVKIVQSPGKYPAYFSKKKIPQTDVLETLTLVLSEKLKEENKTLNVHPNVSGIYNKEELADYLESLREALDSSTSRSPTVVDINNRSTYSNSGHMTGFAYDPTKKLWYFVDSNSLPPNEIKAGDEKALVEAISTACDKLTKWRASAGRGKGNDLDSIAIILSIRNVASSTEEIANQKQVIEGWKRSQTYQKLHEYTPERINKTDKYGKFWLDMAEGEVAKNIISKRSFKSYVRTYLKKLSIPSLIAQILCDSLLGVVLSMIWMMSSSGIAITSLQALLPFLLSAVLSPIGIGLVIGIPLLLIGLQFVMPFIYQKIAGYFNQPTIQNQNVNEITSEEICHQEDNNTQQIITLLKENHSDNENTLDDDNSKCILEEKDSKTDQSLLDKKEGITLKASTENDDLPENNLPFF